MIKSIRKEMTESPMRQDPRPSGSGPTHVCPQCGEWWDVEDGGCDTWFVSAHDNENSLTAKVWTEAASIPVCPLDATSLHGFNIVDS